MSRIINESREKASENIVTGIGNRECNYMEHINLLDKKYSIDMI